MNGRTIRRNRWSAWIKRRAGYAAGRCPSRVTGQTGAWARQDNEYQRRGTANIFWPVEPKAGRHFTFTTPDRPAAEFAGVAVKLALQYPATRTIHLIMDNLNIHCRKSLADLLGEPLGAEVWDCFTVHHTPTHGSWVNQAGIETDCSASLPRPRIPDLAILQRETRAWNCRMHRSRVRINCRFDRKAARRKVAL
jgi:hypothetical protein